MVIEDFIKCLYCENKNESQQTILYAHKYDPDRREAIQIKIETQSYINRQQLQIEEYYITTKGGITAWMKMDPRIVKEIMKRAAVAQNKEFKTAVYVPPLAHDRKKSLDDLLLAYKKQHQDFRYIIRNG